MCSANCIAAGLGARVTVFGLSAGGLVAAWVVQHRPEAARVIVAAPFLGLSTFAMPYQAMIRNVLVRMPNLMLENSPEELAAKPDHNYVRKASRSLGELMLLGEEAAPVLMSAVARERGQVVTIQLE